MELSLRALCEQYGGSLVNVCEDVVFRSVNTDTRSIKHGDLFVALKGPSFDGHAFVRQAQQNGAVAAVVEQIDGSIDMPQWSVDDCYAALGQIAAACRREFTGKVFGITGSSGKTTVKGMLAKVCERAGSTLATEGNLNNHIGVPLTLARLETSHELAVIEAGTSNPGEIKYLAELIQPDIAVVNNVMPVHVEGFGSVEAIAHEKSAMYLGLKQKGVGVLNLDAAHLNVLKAALGNREVITFSTRCDADVRASNVTLNEWGLASFEVLAKSSQFLLSLSVLGEHNVANALAVVAAASAAGISVEHIKAGIESYRGDNGRMQLHTFDQGGVVIDDTYNASPESVKAAIDYLSRFNNSVLVLGDMGELGDMRELAHREVGTYAKQKNIPMLYCIGDACKFTAQSFGAKAQWFENKALLVQQLKQELAGDYAVLVKGSRSARMEDVVKALISSGEIK